MKTPDSDKKICIISGAGEIYGNIISPKDGDTVIAADGGYKHLGSFGIKPDLLIGDFDSLDILPDCENILRLKPEKNETDTYVAVQRGLESGYKIFYIYGGMGGRSDHTLANIQTLSFIADSGGRGYLLGDGEAVTVIADKIEFDENCIGYVSAFAFTEVAEGVNETGLKYGLDNAVLSGSFPIGTSNEFIGKRSKISVKKGKLTVIFQTKRSDTLE